MNTNPSKGQRYPSPDLKRLINSKKLKRDRQRSYSTKADKYFYPSRVFIGSLSQRQFFCLVRMARCKTISRRTYRRWLDSLKIFGQPALVDDRLQVITFANFKRLNREHSEVEWKNWLMNTPKDLIVAIPMPANIQQLAEMTGISASTLYNWRRKKYLKTPFDIVNILEIWAAIAPTYDR